MTAAAIDHPAPPSLRLFIGLWPDVAQRAEAIAHQRLWQWGPHARPTPLPKLHLTLHFLGSVPAARAAELAALLPAAFEPCELVLSQPALWRGSIAVLEPDAVPPALAALHAALGERLREAGFATEDRAWHPHLTLARHAQGSRPPEAPTPLRWQLQALALVASEAGAYRELASQRARGG